MAPLYLDAPAMAHMLENSKMRGHNQTRFLAAAFIYQHPSPHIQFPIGNSQKTLETNI